jgi:hypothetical protein
MYSCIFGVAITGLRVPVSTNVLISVGDGEK